MRFKSSLAILLLALASCGESEAEETFPAPDDLIPEKEIMNIIIDLQILESHYQFRYQRPDVYKNALDSASYYVYEKHGVTEDQYLSSYEYYSYNLDKLYLLYEATLDSVNILVNSPQ